MKSNCFILLSCVSVLRVTGQSDVICSHEPVHVTVGHDVILPCHLEPPSDVTTLTVEWRHNEVIVHVYRKRKDDLEDQDENFRGRTSLFLDELVKGNISLKLTDVTEQDEGNYNCFVPKLDSQVRRGFINLRVDSEENRHKRSQTDSGQKNNNNKRHHSFIVPVIFIIAILANVALIVRIRYVNNNARRDGRGQHEMVEMSEMTNPRDEGRVQDETGEDNI